MKKIASSPESPELASALGALRNLPQPPDAELQAGDYEILVRIRVRVSRPESPYDNPHKIAEQYAAMAQRYTSINASESEVVEVRKVDDRK